MKKLFSIVICLVLGVGSMWAETYSISKYNNTTNGTNGSTANYRLGFDNYVDASGVKNNYVTLTYEDKATMQDGKYIRPAGSSASTTGCVTLNTTCGYTYIHSFSAYLRGSVTDGDYNPVALRFGSAPEPNSDLGIQNWSQWRTADYTYEGASAEGVSVSTTPNTAELKVYTGNPSSGWGYFNFNDLKWISGKNNYASLRDVSVVIWIPEVKVGDAQTGKSNYGIEDKPMTPSTSTDLITLIYDVSEGVKSEDFTATITMDAVSGTDNQGSFSEPSVTLDAAKQQVTVSFTYTSASGENFATSYRAVLRLESTNECDDSYWETVITGAAGEKKIPNELKWTLPEKLYVNSKDESPTSSNSSASVTYTSFTPDVADFDAEGVLYLKTAGEAILSAYQAAEGQYDESNLANCTIQVEKRTPEFDFNPKGVLYPNKIYGGYIFPSADNDPNNNMNPVYSSLNPLVFTVDEAGNVTTLAALATGYLHVEVAETEEWNAYSYDFPVVVERDPIHVPLCMDENLFNNDDFMVEKGSGIIVWENNALRMGTSHSTNPITISCTMHVTGSLSHLQIDNITATSTVNSISFYQSVDNEEWELVQTLTAVGSNLSYELNPESQYIKIEFFGNQTISIYGLCITELVGAEIITPDPIQVIDYNEPIGAFNVMVSNLTSVNLELKEEYADQFVLVCGDKSSYCDDPTTPQNENMITLDYRDGLGVDRYVIVQVGVKFIGEKPADKSSRTTKVYLYDEQGNQLDLGLVEYKPSRTFYHYGPHVTIGGDPEDRADKGLVYADGGTAGTLDKVPADGWQVEIYDKNVVAQIDDSTYYYSYYAKTDKPDKYAFKGWAYTPYAEPSFEGNPLIGCAFAATSANTASDNPYLTPTLYAIFESYFYKAPPASYANMSQGLGSIAVSLEATNAPAWSNVNVNAADALQQVAANGDSYAYKVHYYAEKKVGSYFLGWSTTADGLNIIPGSTTEENGVYHYVPKDDYITKAKDKNYPHVAAPLYAVFRSDIDIRQQDRMIVYIDDEGNGNINDAKVLIDFQKAENLTATLSGTDASLFTLSNRSGSKSGKTITFDATQGLIEMVVSYTGDDLRAAVGKKAEITFSANYNGQEVTRSIVIVVEEAPIITFLPTDGKGTYTVKMTNGSGVNYTMDKTATENLKVAVTHESMSNIEMNLTEDVSGMTDKYYFFGWQMIDGDEVTYLSYDELCTYQFTKSVKVRAQFVHQNHATYFIKDDITNTPYSDLTSALTDAAKLKNSTGNAQVVVFNAKPNGTKITEGILPKGDYTVPTGVTLLIPGDDTNRHVTTLEESDYSGTGNTAYVKWTVEKGTNITVQGGAAVSIYAKIYAGGADLQCGQPGSYGHIQLGENAKMTFEDGANLYAFGYITGSQTASVLMKNGSTVKEMFRITDWRGGSATGLNLNTFKRNKVFIVGQYYVQNIEVPLTLEPLAKEILAAGITVDGSVTHTECTFISTDKGFFQLGDATTLTKYYNVDEDRLVFEVSQQKTPTKVAKLGNVSLTILIMGMSQTIDSKDFVLPVPHNYDVIMKNNTTVQVLYDFAFMPGSTFTIEKGSTCQIKGNSGTASLYVYDKNYSTLNGIGFFGAGNSEFKRLTARPGGMQYVRTTADLVDAKLIVDGLLNCSTNGALYTTNNKTATTEHANITSHGGGKVNFGALGNKTVVHQAYQSKGIIGQSIDVVDVPVAPARLLNENGTYQVPTQSTEYTYVNGTWTANYSGTVNPTIPEEKSDIPVFTASDIYNFSTYVGESQSELTDIVTSNNNVDWTTVTWAYSIVGQDADQFTFTWGTKPAATVKFTPKSEGVKKAVLRITATYEKAYANASGKHKHIYTKDIDLVGNASYWQTNTLAFEDLDVLYTGQDAISLFKANTQNNSKPITITTTPTGVVTTSGTDNNATIKATKVGEVTITATQVADPDNNVAATTITKKVKVTERVVWNWDILYFGTVNENPITVLDGSTGWTLVESKDTSNIIAYDKDNLKATIADQIAGKYGAEFTFKQEGKADIVFKSVVIANPQHLRVDVNNDTVFRGVTLSANENVYFYTNQANPDNNCIRFKPSASSISQWKMTFIGVPDKVHFVPVGKGSWQIEESYNNINWTTSFPWKTIAANSDFEMSLLPSTRYLRISYGASEADEKPDPALKDFYITELAHVKADVKKLYMPFMVNDDDTKTAILTPKEVVLTYANTDRLSVTTSKPTIFKVKNSSSSEEAGESFTILPTTESNPFGITGVEVVSTATTEEQAYLYVYEGSNLVLQIPITTYAFPQELPIKLATDKPDGGDRYYYVTTRTHNAEWDGTDGVRTITLNNAVSDADPYVTFAFRGNPTYISFDHTAIKGAFEIEQSVNGLDWVAVPHNASNDIMNGQHIKRTVAPESNYLRILYKSPYAEIINITNVVIVGDASIVIEPSLLELYDDKPDYFTASVVNLAGMTITVTKGNFEVCATETGTFETPLTLTNTENSLLDGKQMGDIPIYVRWNNTSNVAIEYGMLEVTNPNKNNELMGTVELIGIKGNITSGDMGIYTGVHNGEDGVVVENAAKYTLNGSFEDEAKEYRKVNIDAAIATNGTPLFDYVVIYGETTTNDGTTTITTPTTMVGSNAKTPCYIYKKNTDGTAYTLARRIENTNAKEKTLLVEGEDALNIADGTVKVYITGFCPYASTGYTKADEGVWYFRADAGGHVHVYLEDCFIYSRSKTDDGRSFADRSDGYSFVEPYVRGSGAVLVFACNTSMSTENPMNVTIHTLDSNMLKSHYGCFLQSVAGRAYQASSPVQVRLIDNSYLRGSAVTLNFTDEWEASKNTLTGKRTNGFLSLQKQVNNAPSIDMGNGNTIVNFNGGQVELQNAQIVSPNYKSSLAICPRAGTFAGVLLAYGMGTDDVGGTVNFKDGTTTVIPMYVSPDYAESYLLDKDAEGNPIMEGGKYLTTCLRTPANTFVYGGSHCMMRACSDPESQGGAPRNKPESEGGVLLGLYKYPYADPNPADAQNKTENWGWTEIADGNRLVTPESVPDGYGVSSVTPNTNGTDDVNDDFLNLWFDPSFEPSAQPEIDKQISFWKTCMTKIDAYYAGEGGSVGGDATVKMEDGTQMELIKYLLYCKIDEYIHQEIADESYLAPVKNPAPEGDDYLPIPPSEVGEQTEHHITNEESFRVENKLYYITTATADVWNAFTAPFDVANIYIMETYPENELEKLEANGKTRDDILKEQAKHNADFASFFGVTIALKQNKTFETIYSEYMAWANAQDKELELNTKPGYTPRGKRRIVPFTGTNWTTADFYLNENLIVNENGKTENAPWTFESDDAAYEGKFSTQWRYIDDKNKDGVPDDGILMHQGVTYSMLLPYCVGCAESNDETRTYWDYWSGKFLIFESTDGPHDIYGASILSEDNENGIFATTPKEGEALLKGNSTFAEMKTVNEDIFTYSGGIKQSSFYAIEFESDGFDDIIPKSIAPTESFLIANIPTPEGVRARGITVDGDIIYEQSDNGNQNGTTGLIPTVGGGNDMFITAIDGGINIAVAAPQVVRVLSSTGSVIFAGTITTATDVLLPTSGIYIISGENEVQKILF